MQAYECPALSVCRCDVQTPSANNMIIKNTHTRQKKSERMRKTNVWKIQSRMKPFYPQTILYFFYPTVMQNIWKSDFKTFKTKKQIKLCDDDQTRKRETSNINWRTAESEQGGGASHTQVAQMSQSQQEQEEENLRQDRDLPVSMET